MKYNVWCLDRKTGGYWFYAGRLSHQDALLLADQETRGGVVGLAMPEQVTIQDKPCEPDAAIEHEWEAVYMALRLAGHDGETCKRLANLAVQDMKGATK